MKALRMARKTLPVFEGAKIREFQHIRRPVKKNIVRTPNGLAEERGNESVDFLS
jgi:hypothetical protein